MKTLVIHTPKPTDRSGNRSFEDTIDTCTGERFVLYRKICDQLQDGMPLIILDKHNRKQAEAILLRIELQPNATNIVPRYNILFRNPMPVEYDGERITLLDC